MIQLSFIKQILAIRHLVDLTATVERITVLLFALVIKE